LEAAKFKGKNLYLAFQVADPGFNELDGGVRCVWILGQLVYSGTGHLRDTSDTLLQAKFAEVLVFFQRQPKADHFASAIH